jgi:hypothetical protein
VPVYVTWTERGCNPSEFEVLPAQGIVFNVETNGVRIDLSLERANDSPDELGRRIERERERVLAVLRERRSRGVTPRRST